jgi:hypothetical protein
LDHFGISKIVLTDTGKLFCLFSFPCFSLGTFGVLIRLFQCLGRRLGSTLFLVLL